MTLQPCLEKATGNIVITHLENVDLTKFEPLIEGMEGNRGMIDVTSGNIISKPSAFSEQSEKILLEEKQAVIEQAIAKNPTNKKK